MLFSIIVPIYNMAKYLDRCIFSILKQSFNDFELILINDGSTDDSAVFCRHYANLDKRVRYFNRRNSGLINSRNFGIRVSRGDYVLYVDADDYVSDNWLSVISDKILNSNKKPDLIVFGSASISKNGKKRHPILIESGYYDKFDIKAKVLPGLINIKGYNLETSVFMPAPWNKCYKRELLERYHTVDTGLKIGEDNSFVFEVCINADSMYICKDILYFYNKMNLSSRTRSFNIYLLQDFDRLFSYINPRLTQYDYCIRQQLADYYMSRIIVAINRLGIICNIGYISQELDSTNILRFITFNDLRFMSKCLYICLKHYLLRYPLLLFLKSYNNYKDFRLQLKNLKLI